MRRNPFDELEEVLERMSRQVEEGIPRGSRFVAFPVNVRDESEAFVVTADLPGYDPDEIDLTLSGKRLDIAAERESETDAGEEDEGVTYVRRERETTAVNRSIPLPEEVDAEAVEADLEDGVLTVTLPKAQHESGHRIEIGEE